MLTPISWLKDYIEIKTPIKDLAWRLTELGISVEKIIEVDGEKVLELEITPNRPDLLSIIGIAREIAVIENKSIKSKSKNLPNATKKLSIKVNNDFRLFPRYCGVIIDHIDIKPSPEWMQKRLIQIGLRPINNIVDITNYVMFDLGIPLHAFDYDEIKDHQINVLQAEGGESFTSVDELTYKLPKGAIIIKDSQRIIDLCGIKGGFNSGIKPSTKRVYLQVTADDPLLIRRASQALSLRSDASAIFERGVDKGGLLNTLITAANLIMDLGGGEIASEVIDLKQQEFNPWQLDLSLSRLAKILGIKIPGSTVVTILKNLSLNPQIKGGIISVTVPTYRSDLKIEEDLIEEVARVYGYNNFPKTLPSGSTPVDKIAYYKDYSLEEKVNQFLTACGFTEVFTYSLISKNQLDKLEDRPNRAIRITNPVSLDYEYLRPALLGNILEAIKENEPNFPEINLFELGRVYLGKPPDYQESLHLAITSANGNYISLKGAVEELLNRFGINKSKFSPLQNGDKTDNTDYLNQNKSANILVDNDLIGFIGEIKRNITANFALKKPPVICQLDWSVFSKHNQDNWYEPVSSYPSIVEDMAFILKERTYLGELIEEIKKISKLIRKVTLLDLFDTTRTLRITYQDKSKNLSDKDIKGIREKIIGMAGEKFKAVLKS
ncbi:phenylalanine--tRNA ligase subunit beta [Candidatus Microgenomates bacterium]|nr:phenylalanine--tRNA ligase subunit beta [Candidatus Microgenomates bacterium]